MSEVLGLSTSHDVWTALEKLSPTNRKSREIQLKDCIQLLKKGFRTIDEYAVNSRASCDELAALDACLMKPTK